MSPVKQQMTPIVKILIAIVQAKVIRKVAVISMHKAASAKPTNPFIFCGDSGNLAISFPCHVSGTGGACSMTGSDLKKLIRPCLPLVEESDADVSGVMLSTVVSNLPVSSSLDFNKLNLPNMLVTLFILDVSCLSR